MPSVDNSSYSQRVRTIFTRTPAFSGRPARGHHLLFSTGLQPALRRSWPRMSPGSDAPRSEPGFLLESRTPCIEKSNILSPGLPTLCFQRYLTDRLISLRYSLIRQEVDAPYGTWTWMSPVTETLVNRPGFLFSGQVVFVICPRHRALEQAHPTSHPPLPRKHSAAPPAPTPGLTCAPSALRMIVHCNKNDECTPRAHIKNPRQRPLKPWTNTRPRPGKGCQCWRQHWRKHRIAALRSGGSHEAEIASVRTKRP